MTRQLFKILLITAALGIALTTKAQSMTSTETNAAEIALLSASKELEGSAMSEQTKKLVETAGLRAVLTGMEAKVAEWEGEVNHYLKATDGYTEQLAIGHKLWLEILDVAQTLLDLKDFYKSYTDMHNDGTHVYEGALVTLSMPELYIDVATQVLSVVKVSQKLFEGGQYNMLNGEERTTAMWLLEDHMEQLSIKLKRLCRCVELMSFADLANRMSGGLHVQSSGRIAQGAHGRWLRGAKLVGRVNGGKRTTIEVK